MKILRFSFLSVFFFFLFANSFFFFFTKKICTPFFLPLHLFCHFYTLHTELRHFSDASQKYFLSWPMPPSIQVFEMQSYHHWILVIPIATKQLRLQLSLSMSVSSTIPTLVGGHDLRYPVQWITEYFFLSAEQKHQTNAKCSPRAAQIVFQKIPRKTQGKIWVPTFAHKIGLEIGLHFFPGTGKGVKPKGAI